MCAGCDTLKTKKMARSRIKVVKYIVSVFNGVLNEFRQQVSGKTEKSFCMFPVLQHVVGAA